MSEMTARERIAELLEDVSRPSERVLHNEENVDRIIAIVREALLSDEAVAVMAERLSWADAYSETMQDDQEWRKDAVSALTEVFDAAFGDQQS